MPWYVSDHRRASAAFGWAPRRGPRAIAQDLLAWVRAEEPALRALFAGE